MTEQTKRAIERYRRAMHAIQTGIKFLMRHESGETAETSPKHLRVGVNSALIDSGTLGHLLIRKGIITEEEYYTCLADTAERDVESYTAKLQAATGRKVTLA